MLQIRTGLAHNVVQDLILVKEHYSVLGRLEGNSILNTKTGDQRGEQQ